MKYIVTGGAGFIGSHLAEYLLLQGHDVRIIDNLSSGRIENISHILDAKKVTFAEGSITDRDFLHEHFSGADGVFHQAAFVSVPGSIDDPLLNHTVNITGTLNVLLAARDAGVRKVVGSGFRFYSKFLTLPQDTSAAMILNKFIAKE